MTTITWPFKYVVEYRKLYQFWTVSRHYCDSHFFPKYTCVFGLFCWVYTSREISCPLQLTSKTHISSFGFNCKQYPFPRAQENQARGGIKKTRNLFDVCSYLYRILILPQNNFISELGSPSFYVRPFVRRTHLGIITRII